MNMNMNNENWNNCINNRFNLNNSSYNYSRNTINTFLNNKCNINNTSSTRTSTITAPQLPAPAPQISQVHVSQGVHVQRSIRTCTVHAHAQHCKCTQKLAPSGAINTVCTHVCTCASVRVCMHALHARACACWNSCDRSSKKTQKNNTNNTNKTRTPRSP